MQGHRRTQAQKKRVLTVTRHWKARHSSFLSRTRFSKAGVFCPTPRGHWAIRGDILDCQGLREASCISWLWPNTLLHIL